MRIIITYHGDQVRVGGEEKVLRAFSTPSTFLANLGLITGEVRHCYYHQHH